MNVSFPKILLIVVFLLVIHAVLLMGIILENSPTCDEIPHHIASGYSYLVMRDFRLNPANPPLVRMISALVLLPLHPRIPIDHPSWQEAVAPDFGKQFFYIYNHNAGLLVTCARIPIALLSLLLGLLVWRWATHLYGRGGGLLSLFLYVFCPTILAHGSLATVDMGSALFSTLFLYVLWQYHDVFVQKPQGRGLLLIGIFLGLAQAAKYTNLLLILAAFVFFLMGWAHQKPKTLSGLMRGVLRFCGVIGIAYVIVWLTYMGECKPFLKNVAEPLEKITYIQHIVEKGGLTRLGITPAQAVIWAQTIPLPLTTYALGVGGLLHQGSIGQPSYLFGQWSNTGFWQYFFVAFGVKTPIPLLIFLWVSFFVIFFRKDTEKQNAVFLLVPCVLFFIAGSFTHVQIGIRHILQVYPLACIFAGMSGYLWLKNWTGRVVLAGLCVWYFVSCVSIYPYPLAYFNELVGGPKKARTVLLDSNLDWGQGLIALQKYVKDHGIKDLRLSYFGSADPTYYGFHFIIPTAEELQTPSQAVYAISAQCLDAVSWTKSFTPDAYLAWSIYIYDMREA